jgi:hypothetical protein
MKFDFVELVLFTSSVVEPKPQESNLDPDPALNVIKKVKKSEMSGQLSGK